jgi:hypothetical protein
LRCGKPIALWYSSRSTQMTTMRKQPASRIEAVAILRIERRWPCAACRFVFLASKSLGRILTLPPVGDSPSPPLEERAGEHCR